MPADPSLQAPDLHALDPLVLSVAADAQAGAELDLSGSAVTATGGPVSVRRLRVSECELNAVSFAAGAAPGMAWLDVVASDCGLSNLDGREAVLRRVAMTRCQLVGLGLRGAELRDVRLTDCSLELGSLAGARLRDVVFERVNLTETSFMDAQLEAVVFVDCRLRGTDFRGASLKACAIRGSSLDSVLGVEALRGLRMPWPDVLGSAGALAAALGITVEE